MTDEPAKLFSLTGQCALVTGATRGIGAAIAALLGRAGATVVGTATTPEGAAAITERLSVLGIAGRGLQLDVSDPGAVPLRRRTSARPKVR